MSEADGVALAISVVVCGTLFTGFLVGKYLDYKPDRRMRDEMHKAKINELLAERDEIVRRDERRKVEGKGK